MYFAPALWREEERWMKRNHRFMVVMSCMKGTFKKAIKRFVQGEWSPLGNNDQTLIGPGA